MCDEAFDVGQLTGVGQDLGKTILAQIPAAAQSFVAPFINDIVQGIYATFSLGVAQTFAFLPFWAAIDDPAGGHHRHPAPGHAHHDLAAMGERLVAQRGVVRRALAGGGAEQVDDLLLGGVEER